MNANISWLNCSTVHDQEIILFWNRLCFQNVVKENRLCNYLKISCVQAFSVNHLLCQKKNVCWAMASPSNYEKVQPFIFLLYFEMYDMPIFCLKADIFNHYFCIVPLAINMKHPCNIWILVVVFQMAGNFAFFHHPLLLVRFTHNSFHSGMFFPFYVPKKHIKAFVLLCS